MISFLKENGFPMTIHIVTIDNIDIDEEGKMDGNVSVVTDDFGKIITEFKHTDLRARIHWANGFFRALRLIENGI